jgi:molybdopterin-guanine dinucleotide biosynthesis protein B
MRHSVFGITGWKNSGKTTLTERLVAELSGRGWTISTIKHAHHDFDIDMKAPTVSPPRRRRARSGAGLGAPLGADARTARRDEPSLAEILERLAPCDLVLVEGYKREAHAKIELRRLRREGNTPLAPGDPSIVAIAADHAVRTTALPVFDLDDIGAIADFIERSTGLKLQPGAATRGPRRIVLAHRDVGACPNRALRACHA